MKGLVRLQHLAVAVVMVTAACSAAQNVSPNVGVSSNAPLGASHIISNHGGKFSAAYTGTYSKSGDCSAEAFFDYEGNGNAKFLHSSSEQLSLTWYCFSPNVIGSATLTSVRHPGDSITAKVSSTDFKSPCYGFTMSFMVTGGTGRFQHASGSGTMVVKRLGRKCIYSYSDKWSGTLKF
ncbi:MAG: hypothetical protein JOZ77_12815 [Candidatus Eremiobacteraeota bacterium]|nr:hypothetical protein [Candidatus Eremiobacteraeota bacterium]